MFLQTAEVRRLRTQYKKGTINEQEYKSQIDRHIAYAIGAQVQSSPTLLKSRS